MNILHIILITSSTTLTVMGRPPKKAFKQPTLPQGERYISSALLGVASGDPGLIVVTVSPTETTRSARTSTAVVLPTQTALASRRARAKARLERASKINRKIISEVGWSPEAEFQKLDDAR